MMEYVSLTKCEEYHDIETTVDIQKVADLVKTLFRAKTLREKSATGGREKEYRRQE